MKKFQLEVWNTFDKLCLMSAITKLKTSFADQNWVAISRYTKQLHETISSFIQYDSRSDEWFSAKQCSAQYEVLIKGSGARKKKKVDRNFDYSDVHEALLVSLNQEFCDELQLSLKDIRDEYIKTKQLVEDLDTDKVDDERLDLLINDFLEKEKVTDIKTKLKSMLDEKNAVECESSTKYPSPLSSEPSTSSEHKTANITTSPLLTSLLQSPSPLVRPSPSTSSPTISLLLHSSPSVSLTDPTLSKLLESPSTLPGTSTITALENSPFIIQGKTLDTQQSSPEIKKKEAAEAGGEMSVQRIINDPEEFQRAVGFDDMSDIEQGVVESEVIIENESSPIKRLTPRRLDLENIGDEEPEEEILETVEEIIERVEEAIIETVGENNINELVLNQGIDSVSISDEEIENITIGDNTYEVIVVGSSQEEDQIKIEDATPKTVIDPNQDICREVSLIKGLKKGGKSKDEDVTNNKDDSIIPIIDLVDKEISKNLIVHEDKPVMNAAVSAPEKGPEKQSEDVDNPYNLDINSGLIVEKSAVNRNINSTKSVEHSVSSTSESIDHDLLDQDLCDKKEKIINVCQTNLLGDNSAPNNAIVKNTICYDEKLEEPIKTKSMQESVTDKSEVKVEPHEKVDKILETEKQSNKVLIHSDEFNRICEDKGDCLTDITQNVVKERVENKPSVLFNEDVLKKDINTDSKNEKATKCDKAVVFSDLVQSAAMPTLPDKIGSTTSENIVKQNYSCIMSNKNIKNKSGDETLLEAAESSEVISIGSSDSGSSEELVVLSDIENTPPISKPTVIAKPKLNMEQFEKAINTKNTIASKEEEPVNTKIKHVKEDKQSKKRLETDLEKQKNVIISEEKEQQIFENIETNTGSVRIPELDDEVKGSSDDKEIDETQEGKEIQEAQTSQQAQEILQSQESTIIGETQECLGTGKAFGTEEVQGALETDENLITHESQETFETQATHENQESHDGFDENSTIQISSESDESKSDSTEETEDNSILTTEDSKDGLDDSLKFSSLETLSMPSVDSPPECNDPKLAGLNTKEREFRSLIGRGFEELKSKAAELVSLPEQFREKNGSKKQAKGKNKPRTKKDKPSKSKKVTQKTNWEKSSEKKTAKEKSSKDRTSKEKPREKFTNSGRRSKYLNTFDSKPDSPSLSTTSSDEDRDYKSWKKSILLVYNRLASHKYASVFSKPITDNEAPSYHELILRPMDLSTIKRNIENGVIRTTVEFQRDMLLMVQNAIIYNKCDTPVYDMARAMGEDMLAQMEVMVQALGDGVPLIGDTSEEKQITRARTSKSSVEPPQTKKRKIQEPDDIRPKRNKSSTAC